MKKKTIALLSIIGLTVLIFVALMIFLIKSGRISPRADVTHPATMSLSPSSSSYNIGQQFDVNIVVNTGGASTNVASAIINYDSAVLDVIDADAATTGVQITKGSFYPTGLANSVANNKIIYEATVDLASGTPITGTGTLATIKFQAKAAANPTVVTFSFLQDSTDMDHSAVFQQGTSANILGGVINGSYITILPTPTVDLKVNNSDGPITIPYNTTGTLTWTTTNATTCTASSGWAGTKAVAGSESTGNLTVAKNYILTCYNGASGPSSSDTVTVNVTFTLNIQMLLNGKTNSQASGVKLTIYSPGTTTKIYEKTDVATNTSGQANLIITGPILNQNYDYVLRANYFLTKKIANTAYTNAMTLNFGTLITGDLNNNNQIEANDLSIIISAYRTNQSDTNFNAIADLVQNNQINAQDVSMLMNNWRKLGD